MPRKPKPAPAAPAAPPMLTRDGRPIIPGHTYYGPESVYGNADRPGTPIVPILCIRTDTNRRTWIGQSREGGETTRRQSGQVYSTEAAAYAVQRSKLTQELAYARQHYKESGARVRRSLHALAAHDRKR